MIGRLVVTALLVAGAAVAQAQTAGKVHRIGVVSVLSGSPEPPTVRAFRQGMRDLGYVEGRNLILVTRFAEGRVERLPDLFAEMIGQKVDVLVTGSAAAVLAAKKATTSVPVVFAGVLDPTTEGIVASLARPGGNITGASYGAGSSIAGKWVEFLKAAVPAASRIAVLSYSADPQSPRLLKEIHAAAQSLNVTIVEFDAGNDKALDQAFAEISASGARGMIVTNSPFFSANRTKLVRFAAEKRLPAMYFFNLFPDAGGLMSYGGNIELSYRRAAGHVDKILKGAKAGELPVQMATTFELVINLKAAKALGLTISPALLVRADRVIE